MKGWTDTRVASSTGAQPAQPQQQKLTAFPGFGAAASQQQQQQQQPAFGGFGTSQPQQQLTFGGVGTSQPQQQQPAFGGFGTSQPQQQQQPAFGGFATSQPQQQPAFGGFATSQPQQQQAFGGFGSSQPQQAGGGLFGAQQQAAPAPAFGAFGAATSQPQMGGGLFGATSRPAVAGSLFGSAAGSTAPGMGLFGAPAAQPAPAGNSLFGAPAAGGLFGGQNSLQMSQQPQQQQQLQLQQQQQGLQARRQPRNLQEYMQYFAASWNPDDPACLFKHYFYNIVGPNEASRYGPGPTDDLALYQQAQAENPDPENLVPVIAVGYRDLQKRVNMQAQAHEMHRAKLEEMEEKLEYLQRKRFLNTSSKIEEYTRRQATLVARVLKIMTQVQILRNRGYSVRGEEEKYRAYLETMERELQKPSVFRGRLNEIWAHLQQNKCSKQFGINGNGGQDGTTNASVADEEQLALMMQTLAAHQNGLTTLMSMVVKDNKETDDILRGYEELGYRRR
ncbi:hypothetical protein HDU87_004113 [Geranomyces variabilis]|uniref:Nucleoporin Nup54 alpha-helical domain-containing protein n=1 Tax=Geranomyces variabilis TaxID=109894 RepID=A0AAD5XR32_9FUNG|nr:hypothetical protein HDU87_004113 [Geranomyces variabilis]